MALNPTHLSWEKILSRLRGELNSQTFLTWFQPIHAASLIDGDLVLEVPNGFASDWLETHYAGLISRLAEEVIGREVRVRFRVDPALLPASAPVFESPDRRLDAALRDDSHLDLRYTFHTFVVGNSNRMASAACTAVADKPAETYNPLFIYGGVGMGKTHLMQAIGNSARERRPGSRIFYVSSEKFMNEMILAIQRSAMIDFKNKYRNADLLLIDDIQFLAGKETTQEEFFHTFNSLYNARKQIVMTSDRPPKDIPALQDRLVSRFQAGLVADVQPPDLETRVAILRQKSEAEGRSIPDEVTLLIAENVKSNIRELEGCLIRLIAFASLTRAPITVELAEHLLKDFLRRERKEVDEVEITKVVAGHFNVSVEVLRGKKRTAAIAFPRQVAMYLSRKHTNLSLVEVGKRFGNRDHTTVLYAVEKVGEAVEKDGKLRETIDRLSALLTGA